MLPKITRKAKTRAAFFLFRRHKAFFLASFLSAYSVFLTACVAAFIAFEKFSDPSPIVRWGKVGIAAIAFLSIAVEIYYKHAAYLTKYDLLLRRRQWRAASKKL
jgi:Co/Zn/Cd efflux system component